MLRNKHSLFTVTGLAVVALLLTLAGCHHGDSTPIYWVSYDANGGSGSVPQSAVYYEGTTVTVLGNTGGLTKSGKVLDGWNTNAAGTGTWYRAGDTFSMEGADKTLYAFWLNPLGTDERYFSALKLTDNSWYLLTAKKIGESTNCEVWADTSLSNLSTITSNGLAIATLYESKIYTPITGAFGGIEDVDGNGKVIFLMLDILDTYVAPGDPYTTGYFQPYHMYAQSATRPYSNEADMLFLDTNPGFDIGNAVIMQNFYSTMAHELQHLIEFSETVVQGKPEKDLWINEGLSTGAEYIYGTETVSPAQQTSRIDYFNAVGTSIPYGNNFFVWNGYWEQTYGDVLADYATAYLFFQWLRIHAGGTDIYGDIIASNYADYRAVTSEAFSRIGSLSTSGNLATDWETLLRNWLLANRIKNLSGLFGYEGQINPTTHLVTGTNGWLSPGEAVYSQITGGSVTTTGFASGSHIRYAGIPASGILVDIDGPQYDGTHLLTFNANTNNTAYSDENGKLAASVVSGSQASVQMSLNGNGASAISARPTSYPIDVHFGPDGKLSPDSPRAGTPGRGISAKPRGLGR